VFGLAIGSSSPGAAGVPPLHLITDDRRLLAPGFADLAEAMLRAGGAGIALHLRGSGSPARDLLGLALRLARAADESGARLLVNDRVDVALAAGAHGVHLGARGMAVGDARALLGPRRLVGASVHALAEGSAAVGEGADFLIAGTLFPTPSHPGRPGSGTAWLHELAALGPPVIGIGGVTPDRVAEVRTAGAHGIAVLRGVWEAPRPLETLAAYLAALNQNRKS
jgi:thiamine-phosphate pyrophosphorylase